MVSQLSRFLDEIPELKQSLKYIIDNELALKTIYGSNYLAVYGKRVIDFGSDKDKIKERVEIKYNSKQVLISTIDDCVSYKERLSKAS